MLDDDTSGHTVGIVVVVDVHHRISLGAVVLRKLKRGRGSVRQVDGELRGAADAVAFLAAGSVGMRSDTSVLDGVEGVVLSDAGNDLRNGGRGSGIPPRECRPGSRRGRGPWACRRGRYQGG